MLDSIRLMMLKKHRDVSKHVARGYGPGGLVVKAYYTRRPVESGLKLVLIYPAAGYISTCLPRNRG